MSRYRPNNQGVKKALYFLFLVAVIVALPFLIWGKIEGHKEQINDWATSHNYTVVEIEHKMFSYGPFWYKDEDDEIYRVVLRDHFEKEKVAWFRINLWRFDQEWE